MVYIFCFLCWTYSILFFVGRCFSPSDTCSSSSSSWFGWLDLIAVQCIVGIAALQITLDFLSSARCSLPACSFQPLVQTISYRVDRRATVIIMIMNWIARDGSYTASDTHTPIHAYAHLSKEMDAWCHSKSLLLVNAVLFHLLWKYRTTRRDENSTQLMYLFPQQSVCIVLYCIVLMFIASKLYTKLQYSLGI